MSQSNTASPTILKRRLWFLGLLVVLTGFSVLLSTSLSKADTGGTDDNPDQQTVPALQQQTIWQDVAEQTLPQTAGTRRIVPDRYRLLAADMTALDGLLEQAPLEQPGSRPQSDTILSLPLPDGGFGRFSVEESPVMAPALAAQFPEIKTYRAFGLDDPTASARLDLTPAGFHALILGVGGSTYIDPYRTGDSRHYISYYKRDYSRGQALPFSEAVIDGPIGAAELASLSTAAPSSSGPILHTYRLAVAADGEYTQHFGGVAPAQAQIVTTINRVNTIYERELSLRLQLIGNNTSIVFPNPATDPYGVGDDLDANQTTIDTIIGPANYDIGHLVQFGGGGGVAGLGVVCADGFKAQGLTASSQPQGDAFDVDYVAHEIGHQFGANHTFNARGPGSFSCSVGAFSGTSAYEPGSGSTVMAYAGICGPQDLQTNSDDYFHTRSFDQISAFVTSGFGSTCGSHTGTGNAAPVVEAGPLMTIQANTPFTLTGSATDPDTDPLTYAWEQFDLGTGWAAAGTLPNTDTGSGPIFRSYPPVLAPSRAFPNPTEPGLAAVGESLPTSVRTLTFRLTARDGKGGVSHDTKQVVVSSGPLDKQVFLPIVVKQ